MWSQECRPRQPGAATAGQGPTHGSRAAVRQVALDARSGAAKEAVSKRWKLAGAVTKTALRL